MPPFSPLTQGETIVALPSTVVEVGLTVSGDVGSFDETRQQNLRARLRQTLGCHEPACFLTLRVSGGSVSVAAVLTIPDAPPDSDSTAITSAAAAAAAVTAAAEVLATRPADEISSSLGETVESAAPVSVGHAIVPLVVAPPPPSSPPPSLPPSPPPLPSNPPPSDSQAPEEESDAEPQSDQSNVVVVTTDSQTASLSSSAGLGSGPLIAIIVSGCVLVLLIVACIAWRVIRRRTSMGTSKVRVVRSAAAAMNGHAAPVDVQVVPGRVVSHSHDFEAASASSWAPERKSSWPDDLSSDDTHI